MPVFTFTGKTATGEKVSGDRVAENKQVLQAQLRKERITAGSIKEKGKEFAIPTIGRGKVPTKDIAIFFRQFSVMIDAGLPLVQCLEILAANQENMAFQKCLTGVRTTVEGISLAALIVGALLRFVVPIFANMFAGLGVDLPLPTRIVIGLSTFVGKFGFVIVILLVAAVFALRYLYQNPKGRLFIDGMLLKLPVIGPILRKIAVARFTRTLGTLITSGVPILEGLTITARTSGNAVIEQSLMK